jgi:hypothetical protein
MQEESFWPSAGVEPAFPLKCVACAATHDGGIDKAVDDDWNFCVYCTSQGIVQFAGCPLHSSEFEAQSLAFLKSRTDIQGYGRQLDSDIPERT